MEMMVCQLERVDCQLGMVVRHPGVWSDSWEVGLFAKEGYMPPAGVVCHVDMVVCQLWSVVCQLVTVVLSPGNGGLSAGYQL